jgi:hypothetical protein
MYVYCICTCVMYPSTFSKSNPVWFMIYFLLNKHKTTHTFSSVLRPLLLCIWIKMYVCVRICKVKKVWKLVRFKQKGQKQASFLAFHKGCLLRGPRYISTSFILVCALRSTYLVAAGYQESLFVGWKVYSSSTNKAKIYSYSIFVQQMYWLQDKMIYNIQ